MSEDDSSAKSSKYVLFGVGILVAIYLLALSLSLPQQATVAIVAGQHNPSGASAASGTTVEQPAEVESHVPPPLWMVLPFVLILGVIAIFPLLPGATHWWESNLHRFYVAAVLGAITLGYYLWIHNQPIEAHWPAHHVAMPGVSGANYGLTWEVLANAMLKEYVPFIILLFSLYVISGGIRITGDLRTTLLPMPCSCSSAGRWLA